MTTTLVNYLEECGYEAEPYSGRCMYGQKCPAVITDTPLRVIAEVAAAAGEDSDFSVVEQIACARLDSMGRSSVVYWPGVRWEE